MDFATIQMFYGWGVLDPKVDWYRENNFLTDDQYKEITGKDYEAPTTTADAK
ncbi:XkdX family protein [Levilactobacillus andaensis]|uniref:XkdX family protein n=1 Tax=Levilactobacillus andaensis TaxID=2799570 RepID=UPI0019419618|nr:XkdX family protein [Levilactobacillus andaensis]